MSGFFGRLKKGLSRSREQLAKLIPTKTAVKTLSDEQWQDIEDALIMADCGVGLSEQLVKKAKKSKQALQGLKVAMQDILIDPEPIELAAHKPFVLLMVGVNGTGKTTTIGKLATMFKADGKRVLIGAGDTFRAAAVEQLQVWAERAGADVVQQASGADPAAVAFDTVTRGCAKAYDVVIIDTAGRVQNDSSLMAELAKVHRVIGKAMPDAPHAVWQVIDGGSGQNAIAQVEHFHKTAHTTGLIVTKLDGTAKGGVVLQLAQRKGLAVQYIGVGESLEDLMPFQAEAFIDSLLPAQDEESQA